MAEPPSSETLFPPKKRLKSAVLDCFGYTKNDQGIIEDDGSPICKTCRKKFASKGLNTRVEPDTRLKRVSGTDKALLPSTSIIRVIRVNICARIE